MSNFKATERINGFIYIFDEESNSLVGVLNSKGVLQPKCFKTTTRAAIFICELEDNKAKAGNKLNS